MGPSFSKEKEKKGSTVFLPSTKNRVTLERLSVLMALLVNSRRSRGKQVFVERGTEGKNAETPLPMQIFRRYLMAPSLPSFFRVLQNPPVQTQESKMFYSLRRRWRVLDDADERDL